MIAATISIEEIYSTDELIRFHVLANSNSEKDQQLKLLVKNDLVAYMENQFAASQSLEESRQILMDNLDILQKRAETVLKEAGSHDTVHLEYGRFNFPIKYYGKFSLPAGNYEALRVIIGHGGGQNWWCVLFPPMCFVDENQIEPDELAKYTIQEPEKEIVIKWRLAEIWSSI